MSPITERMLALDEFLKLHNEGEWSNTVSEWTAFNSGGIECEVGEYFYGMIRMMKPQYVLETGTHKGIGASYMGFALKDNFKGVLETIEYIPELQMEAKERIKKMGLEQYVKFYLLDVKDFPPQHNYQFILLDTEPQTRFAEFVKFYPFLDDGGYMFIHDLNRELQQKEIPGQGFGWPFGVMPDAMKKLLHDGKMRPYHFSTPRGLSGFYKPMKEDYVP